MTAGTLKHVFVFVVAAFFAVMWGLLLRSHLAIELAGSVQPDYESLLRPDEAKRETVWGIFFAGQRIGRSHTEVVRQPDGTITIHTRADIQLPGVAEYAFGITEALDVDFRANISPLRGLRFFQARSEALDTSLVGTVRQDQLILSGFVGRKLIKTSISYKGDSVLSEVFSPLSAVPSLDESQIGRSWGLKMVNPVAARLQNVTVTVIACKEIEIGGDPTKAFKLVFATGSQRWTSWILRNGEVVIQGTPFGVVLRREDLSPAALADLDPA